MLEICVCACVCVCVLVCWCADVLVRVCARVLVRSGRRHLLPLSLSLSLNPISTIKNLSAAAAATFFLRRVQAHRQAFFFQASRLRSWKNLSRIVLNTLSPPHLSLPMRCRRLKILHSLSCSAFSLGHSNVPITLLINNHLTTFRLSLSRCLRLLSHFHSRINILPDLREQTINIKIICVRVCVCVCA